MRAGGFFWIGASGFFIVLLAMRAGCFFAIGASGLAMRQCCHGVVWWCVPWRWCEKRKQILFNFETRFSYAQIGLTDGCSDVHGR
jgi:hypothetical protein